MELTYKKKVTILSALVAALALIYILTFVFDPENARGYVFAWLDSPLLVMADSIEISAPENRIVLRRRNGVWYVADGTGEFPAKQDRVADLFSLLARRENYPVRASSSEGIERLGLTEGNASRIVVRGGVGLPLLDLLIGSANAFGTEVYLRRAGWNQIYSAEDDYSFYTESKTRSWYDLRLFTPASVDSIQQVEISFPEEAYILRRSGNGWIIAGNESAALDAIRVEAMLRQLLEADADNFTVNAPETIEAVITMQFGNGSTRSLQAGTITEEGNRYSVVSGSSYFYVLTESKFNNFFKKSSFFYSSN
jgi:hypothetical protein